MRSLGTDDPERIGDYTVVGRLGNGAMGTVYLCRSPGGRQVAVKVARPELAADPRFRERFRQEVAMARAVGGFWTAAVVDADPQAPDPWLATEYVPGPNLHQAVTSHGSLPEPALRRLAAGLAEALGAIHAAGLIHRDLKPANVLLAADGPRVIDFGITRAVQSADLTATGMVVGTPGFLSPEQIEGAELTPASDVFALGCVLVYAAGGHGPYGDGEPAALMYRVLHGQPDLTAVPHDLRPLVSRCLARRPRLRPTPTEVLAEVGTPDAGDWLPEPVRTLIESHRTEFARPPDPPRPPTRPYTAMRAVPPSQPPDPPPAAQPPAGPVPGPVYPPGRPPAAGDRAVFRSSRLVALTWGVPLALAALICLSISTTANEAGADGTAVLFFVVFVLFAVPAVRLLWILLRTAPWVEVSPSGLTIGRGGRRKELAWSQIARARVVEDRARPWLVLWLADPELNRIGLGPDHPAHHGGFRVYPVAHERRAAARKREIRELRAALGWYGRSAYDPSP